MSAWLTYPQLTPQARMRLFCLPYAGGGASIFRGWSKELPKTIEVGLIHLPGRESRIGEPPFTRIAPMVQALASALVSELDRPFAVFGHSMGATIGYEFVRELRRRNGPAPIHLFVSGRHAPQIPSKTPPVYQLPDAQFVNFLRCLNGTSARTLEHPKLMRKMLPILRADFELIQTYDYVPELPLDCLVTAFGGLHDNEVGIEDLDAWREQTSAPFLLHLFEGDHFFIRTSERLLLQTLARSLSCVAKRRA